MSLFDLVAQKPIDIDAVASHLNALDTAGRIAEIRTLNGRLQGALWTALAGKRKAGVDHFVPKDVPDLTFIRHYGRSSAPLMSDFERRFARPRRDAKELWAFGEPAPREPGRSPHFVLRKDTDRGTHVCDHTRQPPLQVDGAPTLAKDPFGLAGLLGSHRVDVMWVVSDHVTVGRSFDKGVATHDTFLLCRQEVVS
jgi:hypothetical protein